MKGANYNLLFARPQEPYAHTGAACQDRKL